MFASLLTPPEHRGETFPLTEFLPFSLPETLPLSPRERQALLWGLTQTCPNPEVLAYRAELAEETVNSPELTAALRALSRLGEEPALPKTYTETPETQQLDTVSRFEAFCPKFDGFCTLLTGLSPSGVALRRCFLACRTFADSIQYRELKKKAAELRRAFGFEYGFTLSPRGEGFRLTKESAPTPGVWADALRLVEEFGGELPEKTPPPPRPHTDTEAAVLTGILRKTPKLTLLTEEFCALYEASGVDQILRLSREAAFFAPLNEIYLMGRNKGYPLCRPTFRAPGFYSEILGLAYPKADGSMGQEDFRATPLTPITAVWGPNGEGYLNAVAFAHCVASAGGLVFAEEAGISPVGRMGDDKNGPLPEEGDEHGLVLSYRLGEGMLPRREEETAATAITGLFKTRTRSVLLLSNKSNLAVLQRRGEENTLPPCTVLQLGEDRTLEEFMLRQTEKEECE